VPDREVIVDVREALLATRVVEALEDQSVVERVNVGDAERVGDD
jgi:hypothetical protein